MWDDDLAPFWIIKNLFLSAKSSWSYSFGCWGGSYMNSLPPESPKEEMVLLKLQRWVKNAAAGVSRTSGVQSVCAGWQLGLLVENLNKSVPNPGEQGHEETFPSDGISFACSSINVCIIPFKGKVQMCISGSHFPAFQSFYLQVIKDLVDSGFGLDAGSARDWFEDERFRLRFSRGAAVLQLLSKGAGWDLVNSCKCWIVFVPQFPFWKMEIG